MHATLFDLADTSRFTPPWSVQGQGVGGEERVLWHWGGLDRATEIGPAGGGEISNRKQLARHLTARASRFLSLCREISGAL